MSTKAKLAFDAGLGGVAAGFYPAKNIAGETAAAIAPEGRVTRSENVARQLAIGAGPLGGLAGLAASKKYNLAGHVGSAAAKHLDLGTIRALQQYGVPLVAGVGGSMAGGLAAGTGVGLAQRLRGPVRKKDKAEDDLSKAAMLDELWSLGEVTASQVEKLAEQFSPEVLDSAQRLQSLEESAPTKGRVLRGALIGAATGPIASLAWRAAAGDKARAGMPINLGKRVHMANAAHGAIFGGLMPAAQHKLETSVEKKHLIKKLQAEVPDASVPAQPS